MEPSGSGFKARGSFGVPPELQRDLEESRKRAATKPPVDSTPMPLNDPARLERAHAEAQAAIKEDQEAAANEAKEENNVEKFNKLKKQLEERLEASISPQDIKEYIFKGGLTKEVSVIPGILKGTFRTLTPSDYFEIDKREAELRDEGKYTIDGITNFRALVTLSFAWVAADGKPLSAKNDPTIREKHLRTLGAHAVELAVAANQDFNTLLKLTLQEKSFLKKS